MKKNYVLMIRNEVADSKMFGTCYTQLVKDNTEQPKHIIT
jgi:hypothetical protein